MPSDHKPEPPRFSPRHVSALQNVGLQPPPPSTRGRCTVPHPTQFHVVVTPRPESQSALLRLASSTLALPQSS
ncbi:hypothetical protein T484DRAFT_1973998 [Baffinella frigidus]|nr:hypothetical protein T484DRAFT_1973998 [Cryptophyta sp. CCMP2293]